MVRKELLCLLVALSFLTGTSQGEWFRLKDLASAERATPCDGAEPSLAICDTGSICDDRGTCDIEPLCDTTGCCDPCGCMTCCDQWTLLADVMFLRRSDADQLALITHQETGEILVDAEHLEFNHNAAMRYQLIREYCSCWGWDIGYFGIDSWTSSGNGGGPVSPVLQGPGIDFPSTAHGTIYRAEYGSDLYSAEFNIRRRVHDCVTAVGGFRWIELQDELRTLAIAPEVIDMYTVDTNNQMYGFQLGADTRLWDHNSRFQIDGIFRAGILFNNADQNTVAPILRPFEPGVASEITAQEDHTAFVGEIGIRGNLQIFRGVYATGGYSIMWLDGLALAPDQIPHTNLISPATANLDTGGTLYFHGATVGLMGCF
jgi:hypothetical protein